MRWSYLLSRRVGRDRVDRGQYRPAGPRPAMRRAPVVPAAQCKPRRWRHEATPARPPQAFVDTYCATCHNQRLKTAGLAPRHDGCGECRGRMRRRGRRSSSSSAPA